MSTWPWPAPADDGGARHLAPGLALPSVALAASDGGTVDLARRAGRAIVFCYPWTGRPGGANPPDWDAIAGAHGSTPQAEGFRDRREDFRRLGYDVLGLSTQPRDWHQELAARLALGFPLLSDADFAFEAALSLPVFETGGVRYLRRLTLVIADGRIDHVFYPVHPPHTHAQDVLAWLAARRAG